MNLIVTAPPTLSVVNAQKTADDLFGMILSKKVKRDVTESAAQSVLIRSCKTSRAVRSVYSRRVTVLRLFLQCAGERGREREGVGPGQHGRRRCSAFASVCFLRVGHTASRAARQRTFTPETVRV